MTREEERSGEGEVGEKRRGKNSREREGGEKKKCGEREEIFVDSLRGSIQVGLPTNAITVHLKFTRGLVMYVVGASVAASCKSKTCAK